MLKLISILFLLFTYVYSAVSQTKLKNGLWELVGFTGSHLAQSSAKYSEDITREIIDIADKNTTYLVKENSSDTGQLAYIRNDYTLSTSYISSTSELRSSIGIFAIKNSLSPSGKTTLKTNINSAVKLKVKEAKVYNPIIPHYRMYLKGKSTPILRIDYQADYEGSSFRVKFANEVEDYVADFDHIKTFDNPATLQRYSSDNLDISAYSASIRDSIDFNANDNSFSKMALNSFDIKDVDGNYNKDLTDYASSDDFDVIVYRFKNDQWEMFNSLNQASSNTFDSFELGQAYWIKINNTRSNDLYFPISTALISQSKSNIDIDYANLKNGWNLMGFKDTYIRYSPTGVFIPQEIIGGSESVIIYRQNRTDDDRHSISIPNTLFNSSEPATINSQSARFVNIYSKNQEELFGYKTKLRSIPAIKVEENGDTMDGIIIISDSKFELNTKGTTNFPITTLAGQALNDASFSSNVQSNYGEYINIISLNDLSLTDINASLSLSMLKYKSSSTTVNDLNDSNKTKQASSILKAFNSISTKNGETTPSNSNSVYLTTLDFNSTADYNTSNSHTDMLLSSGARFSISDSTYIKIYKFNRNGKFKLISSDGSIDIDSGTSNNIDTLISTINNYQDRTKVTATSLGVNNDGDSQFMLTSTKKGIRVLENDSVNLFEDISLSSSSIANDDLSKGIIGSAYSFKNILDMDVVFNREAIDGVGDFGGHHNTPTKVSPATYSISAATIHTAGSLIVYHGDTAFNTSVFRTTLSAGATIHVRGDLQLDISIFNISGIMIVDGDLRSGGAVIVKDVGTLIVRGDVNNIGTFRVESGGKAYIGGRRTSGTTDIRAGSDYTEKQIPLNSTQQNGIDHLDTNINEVPVGLFDTRNQDLPSLSNNLQSNPISTLDFPLSGGIIETLYDKHKKKINSILTMEYSSSNQGFWKITDLTKDIDTLYGNSYDSDEEYDNDYQGIFHLHPNKGYWVQIADVSQAQRPASIKEALILEDSKVTMQSYTHFSNTFDKGKSTTQNHIDHRLIIKFDSNQNFIINSGNNKDYYNVVAIIKGQRYYLKRNGYYFSLNINDNDMPLREKTINEKDEAIILEAYNGTGLALKETDNDAYFKIKYFKPSIPILSWNEENDLILDENNQNDIDNNISKLELHIKNVSDIDSIRKESLLTENNLSINTDKFLKWNYEDNIGLQGGIRVIRAIIKKQDDSKKVSFYSDIRAILYAPLKKGHILEANTTNKVDALPYSYISNKTLTKNNGVQITYLNTSKDISKISMAYYPQGSEGVKSLQGTVFGASRAMFLRVDSGTTNKDTIAVIKYLPEYIDSIFYIEFNGKLYQGKFANDDRYSNDSNAYNLEGETLSVDIFTSGSGSQASEIDGRLIEGGQGI